MDLRWYESFFDGVVVDMWTKAVGPEQTRLEVDFLVKALRLEPGARVLDLPCGFGRHSLELASRGYHVTGVDLSPEMIQEARKRAAAAGLAVVWRTGNMQDFRAESEFDATFCFGNSFGYFDIEGTRAFLRAAASALKPGGRFALDYGQAAECILPRLQSREWAAFADILFLEENRYDPIESRLETIYTFVRDGHSHTKKGLHWVYTVREIRQMLSEAGLTARDLYRSLDLAPFEVGSPLLLVVAEKA